MLDKELTIRIASPVVLAEVTVIGKLFDSRNIPKFWFEVEDPAKFVILICPRPEFTFVPPYQYWPKIMLAVLVFDAIEMSPPPDQIFVRSAP